MLNTRATTNVVEKFIADHEISFDEDSRDALNILWIAKNNPEVFAILSDPATEWYKKFNDGTTELHLAAVRGDLPAIEKIFAEQPERMLETTVRRENILFWAVHFHQYDVLKFLYGHAEFIARLTDDPEQDDLANLGYGHSLLAEHLQKQLDAQLTEATDDQRSLLLNYYKHAISSFEAMDNPPVAFIRTLRRSVAKIAGHAVLSVSYEDSLNDSDYTDSNNTSSDYTDSNNTSSDYTGSDNDSSDSDYPSPSTSDTESEDSSLDSFESDDTPTLLESMQADLAELMGVVENFGTTCTRQAANVGRSAAGMLEDVAVSLQTSNCFASVAYDENIPTLGCFGLFYQPTYRANYEPQSTEDLEYSLNAMRG